MTHEPAWLTALLEELAAHERFPETPTLAAPVLALLPEQKPRWRRRRVVATVAGATTLSVGAIVIVVLGLLRGRLIHGHA